MAVVENAGVELGRNTVGSAAANRSLEAAPPSQEPSNGGGPSPSPTDDQDQPKQVRHCIDPPSLNNNNNAPILRPHDQSLYAAAAVAAQRGFDQAAKIGAQNMPLGPGVQRSKGGDLQMNGDHHHHHHHHHHDDHHNHHHHQHHHDHDHESFSRDMRELRELFSKLNPMAEEFVPPSLANNNGHGLNTAFGNNLMLLHNNNNNNYNGGRNGSINGFAARRRNNQGKRRMNSRTSMAQREDRIRKTVYVSDIDQQVTEEQLAALFITCGQVVDCRICGDPNSVLRFAFIEFTDEEGARAALSLAGTMLGFYPVRVLPSKTAIAPVNPTFLPRNDDEREMCARTIYCTNIDKKVTQADVKLFFESVCGEVYRLRLLGDYHHSTRIAFVEFVMAESAIAALNCSGVVLGSLPIRVSPSKTPVRPRAPRLPMH